MKFNTAISALMVLANTLEKEDVLPRLVYEKFLTLFAPFAPHVTEEIWKNLGNKKTLHLETWPKYDKERLKEQLHVVPVSVDGKVRGTLEVVDGTPGEEVEKRAREMPQVKKALEGKAVQKVIVIPGKIVNIVTR